MARNARLFAATCAAVIALQLLCYAFVRTPLALILINWLGPPLAIAVVLVFVGSDAAGVLPSAAARWERIVERAWAVVLVDVTLSFVNSVAVGAMESHEFGAEVQGVLVFFLATMLVYAEPYLCLHEEALPTTSPDSMLRTIVALVMMVPYSIVRSMMLAWVNMTRIFWILLLEAALFGVQVGAEAAATALHGDAALADIVFGTIVSAALAALFAVAYLDTVAQERGMIRR